MSLFAGDAVIGGDANAAVAAAYAKSLGVAVTAGAAQAHVPVGLHRLRGAGPRSQPAKQIDDLGLHGGHLRERGPAGPEEDGLRGQQDPRRGPVGTGQLTEPAATEPGLSAFTGITYSAGGLGRHSVEDLRRILAGRTVEAKFASTLDAFVLTGQTDREDLALEFQLAPRRRSPTRATAGGAARGPQADRGGVPEVCPYLAGRLALQVHRLLASGDPRFGLPRRRR